MAHKSGTRTFHEQISNELKPFDRRGALGISNDYDD